jgi:hypothetical protein
MRIFVTILLCTALLVGGSRDRSQMVSLAILSEAPPEPCAQGSTQPLKMSTRKTTGGEGGRCVRVTTLPPSQCRKSRRSRSLNLLKPQEAFHACSGKPLPFTFTVMTQQILRRHFYIHGNDRVPSRNTVLLWVRNFRETASAAKRKHPGRKSSLRTPENIERVHQAFVRSPRRSASRNSTALRISDATVRRILDEDKFSSLLNSYGSRNK